MIKRIIIIVIVIAAAYGGIKWLGKSMHETPANVAALSVTVVSPQEGSIAQHLSVTGMTIPREEIVVITELSGLRVKEVVADVGDSVKKGQRLAVLDGESLSNQLAQLQSDYDRAADEFRRVNAIKNTGAVSRESVTQKRTAMQSAKAKLEDARLNLKRSTISASEAGVVFERKATLGALVNANEPLFRIAQKGFIEVEASVPESDLHHLKIGQRVDIDLAGVSAPIPGKIRLISPRVDSATRTANIRVSMPKESTVPVGLFANATITTSERKGIILPATSIQQDSNGSFVWKLDEDKKAVRLPVTVMLRDSDSVMAKDIPTDIVVIARAGAFIKEGDAVTVVEGK
jgi:HlyD family secretion protein